MEGGKSKPEHQKKYVRFRYSDDCLQKAVEAIRKKEITINAASRQYGIPKSTLFNKTTGKVPMIRKMGPATILTTEEETTLETWILSKAVLGFPMHPDEVKDSVQRVLKAVERPNKFVDDRPGRKWLHLFLQRHPKITTRNTELISKARASVTEENIRKWFQEMKEYLIGEGVEDILSEPNRIFNGDETGLQTCPKTGKLLGPKNYRNFYEIASGPEKECITVLCTFSASGESVPPMIVYPYKRIPRDIAQTIPDEWGIGRSDSGWMTSATFYEFIANIFFPWLQKNNIKFPVLLLLDGHKSHINMDLYNFCVQKRIILYCLLPNATHILQPCDVSVFKSLKGHWKKTILKHKQNTNTSVTKNTFAPLFHKAFEESIKPEIIKNGFRKCGLFPFSADAVNYSQCISTRRLQLDLNCDKEVSVTRDEYETVLKVIKHHIDSKTLIEFNSAYESEKAVDIQFYNFWKICKEATDGDGTNNLRNGMDQECEEAFKENSQNIANFDIPDIQEYTTDFTDDLLNLPLEIDGILYPSTNISDNSTIILNVDRTKDIENVIIEEIENPEDILDGTEQESITNNDTTIEGYEKKTSETDDLNAVEELEISEKIDVVIDNNSFDDHNQEPQKPKTTKDVWLQHLHWPNIEKKCGKRKQTTSMPFAITSKKWKEYTDTKESEKREKEAEKLKQKLIREKKKQEATTRRTAKTKHMGRNKAPPATITCLQADIIDTGNQDKNSSVFQAITVGTYVIITYNQKYFPGIVETIDNDEYEVRAMTPAGLNTFRWPDCVDQIWYKKSSIAEVIEAPKLIRRGSYECPEIRKYSENINPSNTRNILSSPEDDITRDKNGAKINDSQEITIGAYVIIMYNQKYFPGVVENAEGGEYEVRAMTPAGPNTFKWPERVDQIWYEKTSIVEMIEAPKLIRRGFFECPEMLKFV